MRRRLALVLVLSAIVLVYRGIEIWLLASAVVNPLAAGFETTVRDGAVVVTAVRPRDFSGHATPGAAAGIRAGDRLVAIETAEGRRYPLRSLAEAADGLKTAMIASKWTFVVGRDVDGAPREVRLTLHPAERDLVAFGLWILMGGVIPFVAILTALLIAYLKPGDNVALLASLLFLAFSALFGSEFWLLPRVFWEAAVLVHTALVASFGYLFLRFFLVFPSPSVIERRLPWLKTVLLVPVVLFVGGSVGLTLTAIHSFAWAERLGTMLGGTRAVTTYWILTLGMIVVGMVSLGSQLIGAATPGDRRRVAILLSGTVAAFGPFLALLAYVSVAGYERTALWLLALVVPLLLLFPLSFAYVVVRHRVLGVPLIIRRGVRYALVSRGFLAGEALALFIALYFGLGPLLVARFPDAGAGAIATTNAMATLVAIVGVERLNRRLRPVIDRRFFRGPYNPQEVLADVGAALKLHAAEPSRLVEAVAERLGTALKAGTCGVFLDGQRSASRRLPVRGPDEGRGSAADHEYGCEAWVALDSRTGRPAPAVRRPGSLRLPADVTWPGATGPDAGARDPVFDLDPGDLRAWLRQVERESPPAPASSRRSLEVQEFEEFGRVGARLVAPLASQQRVFGWIVLGDRLSEEAYSPEDKELVRAVAQQTAAGLEYAMLIDRVAQQEALRRELEIARQVQAGLFPQRRPRIRSLDYDGACRTAQEVGGDYFDFLELDPARLVLAVGDISGKGVSAALLMASLQALLRSRVPRDPGGLDALMVDINALLLASIDPSKFASLFYSVYDGEARALAYVNAGHNPPLLFRAGESAPRRLAPTGPALGLMSAVSYRECREQLTEGDLLVVYTDGVTEAMNAEGDEYGEDRLVAAIRAEWHRPATALRDAILEDLDGFVGAAERHDDVTLVVARVTSAVEA